MSYAISMVEKSALCSLTVDLLSTVKKNTVKKQHLLLPVSGSIMPNTISHLIYLRFRSVSTLYVHTEFFIQIP